MIRDKFKREKLSERSEERQNDQGNVVEEYLNQPWGDQNRGQNFVKARSGTGGGYVAWSSPPKEGKKNPYEKQKKNIKDLVL